MSITNTLTAITLAFALLSHPTVSLASQHGRQAASEVASSNVEELTALEADNLTYMREEEKMARDVYLTMYDAWGLNIFSNIAASEQTHTDAVAEMLEKYKLPDPVVDDRVGIFVNQKLIDLYDTLLARGYQSSLEALYVGALIEEVDMVDLKRAIEETDNEDTQQLYENLLSGSRNHLRAFVGLIEDQGIVYEAQFLPQDEVDAIVDSPVERSKGGGSR
jgi:hypothetical protein